MDLQRKSLLSQVDFTTGKKRNRQTNSLILLFCTQITKKLIQDWFYMLSSTVSDTVVVSARDTDLLLLLVAHLPSMPSANVRMMAGTAARRQFFNIRAISENLPAGSLSALLPFHALTGSDTTSHIQNHSKLSAWKTFQDKHHLLASLGEGELSANKVKDAEKFICAIYNCGHMESLNDARFLLFSKTKKPEALPPTKDALELHIKRVHYQSLVWKQASCQ
ncbi:Hypothetical predicted protein [Paramuricea clavata]|uniref:Uncharacterized protein n=1 Tax=Paramuricea clavata TaxID=317549 RepID=A0A6S7GL81_PARCT|nr:Hypothetical predicted protein [Paramuricea clavata]